MKTSQGLPYCRNERYASVRHYRARHWRSRRMIVRGFKKDKARRLALPGSLEFAEGTTDMVNHALQEFCSGRVERLFCTLAHLQVSDVPHTPHQVCDNYYEGRCLLTAHSLCLFVEPFDPQWGRIRQSVELELAAIKTFFGCADIGC